MDMQTTGKMKSKYKVMNKLWLSFEDGVAVPSLKQLHSFLALLFGLE